MNTLKTVMIIGATSGIGRGLAEHFHARGYRVIITGRREHLLDEIERELGDRCHGFEMDVTQTNSAQSRFAEILRKVGDVDIVVLSAGTGAINIPLDWEVEEKIITTDVIGFAALASCAYNYFRNRGFGHLVGITSIAGERSLPQSIAYSASKSFCAVYLTGIRNLARREKKKIYVTDIRPGYVDTILAQGPVFWCASVPKAAEQIFHAIHRKKKVAYITKRWYFVSLFARFIPDWILSKLG